jgi:flavin reductase (DIM6/NTAB) family NADH-FMN oxidoreductase RutF
LNLSIKDILNHCGSHSGKDVDKVKECGLIPIHNETGCVYFEQAKLVLLCEKIYFSDIDPAHFIEKSIHRNYPDHDYHRMYIGKVQKCLIKN